MLVIYFRNRATSKLQPCQVVFETTFCLLVTLFATPAKACTSFFPLQSYPVFGKSFDWNRGHGQVVVNPVGVLKQSLAHRSDDVPFTWTSKFGSITFNLVGKEFPLGGMNTAGLISEIMWLSQTKYQEAQASVPSIDEFQWTQFAIATRTARHWSF